MMKGWGANGAPPEKPLRLGYRLELTPAHTTLRLWINGGCAGHVCVRRGDEEHVVGILVQGLRDMGAQRV